MQASSDIFLGWLHVERGLDERPRDFYGRQLKDWKGSFDARGGADEGRGALRPSVRLDACSRPRPFRDRIAIASYLGGSDVFDRAIAEFAGVYADQNELDYAALKQAVDTGRVAAQVGL